MKYRTNYQLANDIDWFAEYNGIPLHFASNGCKLPNIIDSSINRNIQRRIEELIDTQHHNIDIQINKQIRQLFTDKERSDYIASFVTFAQKGFVSLDTLPNHENNENNRYIVVAYPSNRQNMLNELFPELYRQLQVPELPITEFNPNYLTRLWSDN